MDIPMIHIADIVSEKVSFSSSTSLKNITPIMLIMPKINNHMLILKIKEET